MRGKSLEADYLLSSLFRCALCGGPLQATGSNVQRAYFCLRGRENPDAHPGGKGVTFVADPVEDAPASVVRLALMEPQPTESAVKKPARVKPPKPTPKEVSAESQAYIIRARMNRLVNLLLDEKIEQSVYDKNHAELERVFHQAQRFGRANPRTRWLETHICRIRTF